MHILIVDLAAANLLRDNAALAAELGLDYDDLYIENGQIFIKTTGRTAAQIAAIQAKLDALMATNPAHPNTAMLTSPAIKIIPTA